MNKLKRALVRIAADLRDLEARWAVVGGLAVSARAEPRFTRDVDISVAIEVDADAERLVQLGARGYEVLARVEQDAVHRLATIRLRSPESGHVVVDLLFASSGIERETVDDAENLMVLDNLVFPVARVEHLLAMKVLSNSSKRPRDVEDIAVLLNEAAPDEVQRVAGLLALIEKRGFSRKKNLAAEWRVFREAST